MSRRRTDTRHRADSLPTERGDGLELDGERMSVSPSTPDNNRSTQAAQREPYSQDEQRRRRREARHRIERQREQRQAARYFCQLQRGCVRRV